jgi:protein-L-isoaspartate(D-aspartate) O-methyltransferase
LPDIVNDFAGERRRMVDEQLRPRGIDNPRLLAVIESTPRHLFVPEESRPWAYADSPQPIGFGQTISQPFIVALMTQTLHLTGSERVLEIGAGSGYQAAILVAAAAPQVPPPLLDQLAENGRMIIPKGRHGTQDLELWRRKQRAFEHEALIPVAFVPLRGKHGLSRDER